ncbi:MAG: transposase [Mycobacterium sp.]|uniref:transposase n=1 Tax=Mycobacterium sp. TaxID=1785 RepID=UPI0026035DFF|nr:transposase [Mycobacterium sp.]MDI3313941.1 transposase [Mycobacterium sp.]
MELTCEHVAEFSYQPGKCRRPYRVIALRKNISKSRGEAALIEEIRYFFYITTRTDLSAAEVVACANDRCDQENVIEQLKNGVNALRVPLYDLVSNWAYMVIAALAWNIKSWFAMMPATDLRAPPTPAHDNSPSARPLACPYNRQTHAEAVIRPIQDRSRTRWHRSTAKNRPTADLKNNIEINPATP